MEEEKSVYEVEVDCRAHDGEDETLLVVAPSIVEAHAKAVKFVNDRNAADGNQDDVLERHSNEILKVESLGVIDVQ